MTHPKQSEIAEYVAGFTDGDGTTYLSVQRDDSLKIGYGAKPTVEYQFYISGLVDSDGTIGARTAPTDNRNIGYEVLPRLKFEIITERALDVRERFLWMFNQLDVNYYERIRRKEAENEHDTWALSVQELDSVHTLLDAIRPHLVLKQQQAGIMLDEIIPRVRRGEHRRKRGFLAIMGWRDVLNYTKTGVRGKYHLLYFEDEWGIRLDLEQHGLPDDLRDRIRETHSDDL